MDPTSEDNAPKEEPRPKGMADENKTPAPGEVFWSEGPLIGDSGQHGSRFQETVMGVIRCAWRRALDRKKDRATARDIGQDVGWEFVEEVNKNPKFFHDTAFQIGPYVTRIADNTMCDRFRRERTRRKREERIRQHLEQEHEGEPEYGDVGLSTTMGWQEESSAELRERVADLAVAKLAQLPKQRRTAWHLFHDENLKAREVAKIMGLSVNTVRMHLRLALLDLRRGVEEAGLLQRKADAPSLLRPSVATSTNSPREAILRRECVNRSSA